MDIGMIKEFILPGTMIVIPVLYIIGIFIHSTPKIANWSIPYILLLIGILVCSFLYIPEFGYYKGIITGIIQGILAAGLCVFTNQLIKQAQTNI